MEEIMNRGSLLRLPSNGEVRTSNGVAKSIVPMKLRKTTMCSMEWLIRVVEGVSYTAREA